MDWVAAYIGIEVGAASGKTHRVFADESPNRRVVVSGPIVVDTESVSFAAGVREQPHEWLA